MRQIIVGQITPQENGTQRIDVWFRFQVSGAARIAYYQKLQANYLPIAPGDYAGTELQEAQAFTNGQWVERTGFDIVDSTTTLTQKKTRLQNLYATSAANFVSDDNTGLAVYATSWDGSVWTDKAA